MIKVIGIAPKKLAVNGQGNGLEELPAPVGQLPLLKVLDVSMNKLTTLPNLSGLTMVGSCLPIYYAHCR